MAERHGPQFIPKLEGKKVIIRLISGGQPITGTISRATTRKRPHPDGKRAALPYKGNHIDNEFPEIRIYSEKYSEKLLIMPL